MQESGEKFIELLQIILRLRSPDGCPWDRKQTPRSLKKYLIEEAYETAEALEKHEKKEAGQETERFASLPKSMPALRRAQRVSEKAAGAGFDWSGMKPVFAKLDEEVGELKTALSGSDQEAVFEELGDVLFVMVNICRMADHNAEDALNEATAKFIRRFGLMEEMLAESGLSLAGQDDDTLLQWWSKTKKN